MPSETYILNLQLQLTGAIEQALTSVQESLQPVVNQAKQLKDVLGGISAVPLESVATGASRIATSMSLTNEELARAQFSIRQLSDVDWASMSIDKIDDAVAQYEQLGEIQQFLTQQTSLTRIEQGLLRKIESQREVFSKKFRNTTKEIGIFIKEESIFIEKILKNEKALEKLSRGEMKRLGKKIKQIETLEKIGYAMNGLDSNRAKSLSASFTAGKQLNTQYHKSRASLKVMAGFVEKIGGGPGLVKAIENFKILDIVITTVVKSFKELLNTQEAFRASTFRVSGTISQLVNDVNMLQASLGISGDQAKKTVAALAQVGSSREEVEQFAKTNAMFTEVTKGSAEAAALLQRRLKQAGASFEDANNVLNRLTVQSARFGLTATDVNNIMNTVNTTIFEARAIYGMSGDAAAKFSKALVDLAAAAKAAGADVQSVMGTFTSVMQDPLEHIILLGENFNAFQSADTTQEEKMALLGKSAKEALAGLEGLEPAVAKLKAKVLYNIPIGKLQEMADSADKFAEAAALGGGESAAAAAEFDKSFGTVLGTLSQLMNSVLGVIKVALSPFADLLTDIAKELQPVIKSINENIVALKEWLKVSPNATMAIKILTGAIAGLLILGSVTLSAIGFIKVFRGGLGIFTSTAKKIKDVGSSMLKMGQAAKSGGAARSGLKQFAEGLKSFFNALKSISWTTIAKVAVLLGIMTLAVFGMAAAAKYLGSEGVVPLIAITVAMIGMSVALYILTPALAALAVAGTAAIPIIVVLALAVAGVALAIGYATKLMLEGVAAIAPFAGSIMELVVAGLLAFAAAPGFVALALGLGVLTMALGTFGLMSLLFGNSVNKVITPLIALGESMQGVSFEPFARLLDTIDRINISKVRKVAEAIGGAARASAAASALGILKTRAETIATVKTTGETGRSMEKERRDREELDFIKSLVNKLDDVLTRMGDPAVTKIFEILAEHLPKMSDKESGGDFGLSSSNSWG